ncbi:hypothetical protein OIU78_012380 [Salix suchowensis]|nr:hypothetical protein OIU78_012380 [Salix suchowensis]
MDPKENLVLLAAALLWMVLSISLDGHMRILTYVGADCYSKSGARESPTGSYAVLQAFPFSNTRNKFFGIGCDTIALISGGYHGDGRKDGEGCSADQLLAVKILVGVGASVIVLVAILEDCIAKEGNVEQVDKVARLGKTCLRVKGEERPTMKEVAMELERLRMVGKHPWTNVESNYEQTEYLLGKQIDACGHGKSGESSAGYQVIGSVLLPSGGR